MKLSISAGCGLILTALGLIVMTGWYFHVSTLLSIIPHYINMVFNTAFCFALSGTALWAAEFFPDYRKSIYSTLGSTILIFSALVFSQYLLHMNFGIDEWFINVWLHDQNPFPGRMAFNTSFVFMCTGISLILLPRIHTQHAATFLQTILFLILFLGISALLGYILKLEFLYSWYQYTRMAIHTALGVIVLGVGLWSTWMNSDAFKTLYNEHEDKKILFLSAMILISIASISSLTGYAIAANPVDRQIELILFILAMATSVGLLLLHWQVMPLVKALVKSKQSAIESSSNFEAIFNNTSEGLMTIDTENTIQSCNVAAAHLFGYDSGAELIGKNIFSIIPLDTGHLHLLHERNIEVQGLKKNKDIIPIELSITHLKLGDKHTFIGMMRDISERKITEKALSFKAYFDTLTGLVNRNQLEQSMDITISSALRNQQKFAIFFIDLDRFKHINDTLGHDAGDMLLKIVSERLKNNIRKTDIAARLGGDEFILVLNGTDNIESAALFAEKILNTLLQPIVINEHELFITASIGISFYPSDGTNYAALVKSADLALYKAKEKGRNNYQFCTSEMNQELNDKLAFKNTLKNAVKNNELFLTYLPKMNAAREITGFETLLRWSSQKYGLVSPAKIIPLAEEIGIIHQLSNWIMEQAIRDMSECKKTAGQPFKITINISSKQYLQTDFAEVVLNVLSDLDFSPFFLELEINESLIMQDPEYSIEVINALKTRGVHIIIDNFGTGYSSLNYLNQLKIDYVKIARHFISDVMENAKHRELVSAMIALCKTLNIKIIAEGIETKAECDYMFQLGSDEVQGYFISEPLKLEEIPLFLKNHQTKSTVVH